MGGVRCAVPFGHIRFVPDHPLLHKDFPARLPRDVIDAEVGGDPVDLVEQLLARFVVIGLVGAGDRLVAIEPVEHLEVGRDGRHVARGDRFGRELHHRREAVQLQLRVVGAAVDRPFLQNLGHDLANARAGHALLARDLIVAQALAQARENSPPPQNHALRAHPPPRSRRRLLNHACLFAPPAGVPVVEWRQNSRYFENRKENVEKSRKRLEMLGFGDAVADASPHCIGRLNLYLQRFARQNHESGGAKCFVAGRLRGFGRGGRAPQARTPARRRGRRTQAQDLGSSASPILALGKSSEMSRRADRPCPLLIATHNSRRISLGLKLEHRPPSVVRASASCAIKRVLTHD